jgi:hypothetical protein
VRCSVHPVPGAECSKEIKGTFGKSVTTWSMRVMRAVRHPKAFRAAIELVKKD